MAAYADVEDPIVLLNRTPASTAGPKVGSAIQNAGFQVQMVDWVWRRVVGQSLVDSIIKPITGDFDKIAEQAGQWSNVAVALQAIRNNLNAGLGQLQPAWRGDSADKFRQLIGTSWTVAIEVDAQAANAIGFALRRVAEGSRAACDQALRLIRMLVDKLIQAAALLPIPVVGWARAVKLVYDGIQLYNAILRLIEGIRAIIHGAQAVIQGIQQVGSALSKIKDIHNLNDALNVANEAGRGMVTTAAGARQVNYGANNVRQGVTDAAGAVTSAHDNATGLLAERAAARERAAAEAARQASMRASAGDPKTDARSREDVPGSGEPVDVATGQMFLTQTDVELPGALPLVLERTHFSSYRVGLFFGPSWASTLDQRIEVEDDAIYVAGADGGRRVYPHPAPDGAPVYPREGARIPLVSDGDGFTLADPRTGQTLHFPTVARGPAPLAAIEDRNGNRIDIDYGPDGAPVEVRHSGGYRIAVASRSGLITELRLRDSRGTNIPLVRFDYDTAGRLVEVTNSTGLPFRFGYDADGRVTRWEDRNGQWFTYQYDELGRCVRTEGAGAALTGSWEYRDGLTIYTDSLGHTTEYHLNELRQVVRHVDALGNATVQDWDRFDRLLYQTDPLGATTRYEYDQAGNLLSVTAPDGGRTLTEYNAFCLPTVVTDATGAVWLRTYDERGNVLRVTDPLGVTIRYEYSGPGHVSSITDSMGNVGRFRSNAAGLPIESTDPTGAVWRYRRDQFGRIMETADPFGSRTRLRWSVEGKLVSRVRPDGVEERWVYDGEGNQTRHVDAAGRETVTTSTHFDRVATELRSDGLRREFAYDSELRLTSVTNAAGLTWRYEYDAVGNLIAETDFNGRRMSYTHDAAGALVERTNGAGQSVRFERDAVGRVLARHSAEGVTTFAHDAEGRILRATNPDAEVVLQRDAVGRVLAETVNGRTLSVGYDECGRRTRRVTPTGAVSEWSYEFTNLPTALRTAGRTIRFNHDGRGREVERVMDSGAVVRQAWDTCDRLTGQTVSGSTTVRERLYSYRADGYVTRVADRLGGNRDYELDGAGRVTAIRAAGWAERYAYDSSGNVTAAAWSADDPQDQGDRELTGTLLRRAGMTRYQHDPQGRIVSRQRRTLSGQVRNWTYVWDSDDRLIEVTTPEGTRWRYRYDAFDRRIAKQRIGPDGDTVVEQVDFTWDGYVLAEQVSSGEATCWDTEPGDVRPITQIQRTSAGTASQDWIDARFYAIVTDIVGAPTELLDADGKVAWHARTTIWGARVGHSTGVTDTPLRLPGQYHDAETGWHYNLHRYYDPGTGYYASADPLGLAPSPNPHAYVHNPVVVSDPFGLAPRCSADLPKAWAPTHEENQGSKPDHQSHHFIQDAAVKNVPQVPGHPAYDRDQAPTVMMQGRANDVGSAHWAATNEQRLAGGGTYGAERDIGVRSMIAGGMSPADARAEIARGDRYFVDHLGWTHDTPTTIPGNRRRP